MANGNVLFDEMFQGLLAGNPTAAGQGFRAPGFDAMTSFERVPMFGGGAGGGGLSGSAAGGASPLINMDAIEALLQVLQANEPQQGQGSPIIQLLLRLLGQGGA